MSLTTLSVTAVSLTGGITAVAGLSQVEALTFGGTWAAGDNFTLTITDSSSALQNQYGYGYASGLEPTFCYAFDGKVYALAGNTILLSASNNGALFNDPNGIGNGYLDMNFEMVAMSSFQGKLAFFCRDNIYIYNTATNLASWSIRQELKNIGTTAPLSVQAIGDLDVMFLSDTGIRSLRVRDSSLNGFITDMGSPIDELVIGADTDGACAIVDPQSNRYWLYLDGSIYVLSYFPSSKITAWTIFEPTTQIGEAQVTFVPERFFISQGQVYAFGSDANGKALYQYGGADNKTYDNVVMAAQTPFLDAGAPGVRKTGRAVDLSINEKSLTDPDSFQVYCSMDPKSAGNPLLDTSKWSLVFDGSRATFDTGINSYTDQGTHFSFYIQTKGGTGPAVFSQLLFHYEMADQKG